MLASPLWPSQARPCWSVGWNATVLEHETERYSNFLYITSVYFLSFFLSIIHSRTYSLSAVPISVPISIVCYTPHLFRIFAFVPTLFMHLFYFLSTYVGCGTAFSSPFFHITLVLRTYFIYALYLLITPILTVIVANPVHYRVYPRVQTYFRFSVVLIVVPLSQEMSVRLAKVVVAIHRRSLSLQNLGHI